MPVRMPRLEGLLGTTLDAVSEQNLQRLVDGSIPEDSDLEYKQTTYGRTDSEKRALAGDLAALANTVGGLLIIGIAEDGSNRASALTPIQPASDEVVWMHQVVAGNAAPPPQFEVEEVASQQGGSRYLVIPVPRSPYLPHAVRVGDALRYPVRDGPRIRYLSETEVAEMYGSRFRTVRTQRDRLEEIETESFKALSPDYGWATLTLVPSIPASVSITHDLAAALRQWGTQQLGALGRLEGSFFDSVPYPLAGIGKIVLSSEYEANMARYSYAELHGDGSVFLAVPIRHEGWPSDDFLAFPDEHIVLSLIQMLHVVRDRPSIVHEGGEAIARFNIYDWHGITQGIQLVHFRHFGALEVWPRTRPVKPPFGGIHTINLDLLSSPAELISTAKLLATDIFQAFGVIELPQLTMDGKIRKRYFHDTRWNQLEQWTQTEGIELIDETLPTL